MRVCMESRDGCGYLRYLVFVKMETLERIVLIILSGKLQIWGLRSEICRLVPLDYVDYLTALLPPSS